MRLSIVIQRSSRRDKFARSSRERPYFTYFDTNHVREMFPYARDNVSLVGKLGKANAQRRQWLSYRRHHHEKLSRPTEEHEGIKSEVTQQQSWNIRTQNGLFDTSQASVSIPLRSRPDLSTHPESTVATSFYDDSKVFVSTL